jgi:hypothetical protein
MSRLCVDKILRSFQQDSCACVEKQAGIAE